MSLPMPQPMLGDAADAFRMVDLRLAAMRLLQGIRSVILITEHRK